jgi:hypothetical protein
MMRVQVNQCYIKYFKETGGTKEMEGTGGTKEIEGTKGTE